MLIKYFGPGDLIDVAFFDVEEDEISLDILSATPTQVVAFNPSTGATTTFTGTGLPSKFQLDTGVFFGTITGWTTTLDGGGTLSQVTGISWGLGQFIQALDDEEEDAFLGLLNLQDITFDGSAAVSPVTGLDFWGVTRAVTLIGTPFGDQLAGGDGNDTIRLGGVVPGQGDWVAGSPGNDHLVFTDSKPGDGWILLDYSPHPVGTTVTVNGVANSGSIASTAGNDIMTNVARALTGTEGITFNGSAFNDSYTITLGQDQWVGIDGGQGRDSYTLTLNQGSAARLTFVNAFWGLDIDLSTGRIHDDGYGNVETVTVTGPGRLEIHGTRFNDDVLVGSARDESFILGGGMSTLSAGGGWDLLRFDRSQVSSGVTALMAAGTATGSWMGAHFQHQFSGIEEIRGSRFADVLDATGVSHAVRLVSGGGNDTLRGGAGDDTLVAGAGYHEISGGGGHDVLQLDFDFATADVYQTPGGVSIETAGGVIQVTGVEEFRFRDRTLMMADLDPSSGPTEGDDELTGGPGADLFDGLGGDDLIYGGAGDDTLIGGAGADTLYGGDGNDELRGGIGNDLIHGDQGHDLIQGGAGDDELFGDGGNDTIQGGDGHDTIYGGAGDDVVNGGAGRDLVYLGAGNDRYEDNTDNGPAGADTVYGGDGHDWIHGGGGPDELHGDGGNDTLYGGQGHDTLYGGAGVDSLIGGLGHDVIFGGTGDDWIYGGDGNDTVNGGLGRDWVELGAGDDRYEDTTENGPPGADTVYGGSGNDWIHGGGGPDELYGGIGNDTLYGGQGHDWLYGGDGADEIYGGLGNDSVNGGNGRDRVWLGDGNDRYEDTTQDGLAGQDTVYGGNGHDWIHGGGGNDLLYGDAGFDTIYGGQGDDWLYGGDGYDQLYGGLGNDTIYGGNGNDTLTGGAGADQFVFRAGERGASQITDFGAGADLLVLERGLWAGTLTEAQVVAQFARVTATGVLFDFGSQSVLLTGLSSTAGLQDDILLV